MTRHFESPSMSSEPPDPRTIQSHPQRVVVIELIGDEERIFAVPTRTFGGLEPAGPDNPEAFVPA